MASNTSDQFFEPSTDTNANFGNSVAGQTNSFFLPKVYSKQVLNFFRKDIYKTTFLDIAFVPYNRYF